MEDLEIARACALYADDKKAENIRILDLRGLSPVVLVPSQSHALVRQCYAWGGRNVELHAAQMIGRLAPPQGIAFPTFLPESG